MLNRVNDGREGEMAAPPPCTDGRRPWCDSNRILAGGRRNGPIRNLGFGCVGAESHLGYQPWPIPLAGTLQAAASLKFPTHASHRTSPAAGCPPLLRPRLWPSSPSIRRAAACYSAPRPAARQTLPQLGSHATSRLAHSAPSDRAGAGHLHLPLALILCILRSASRLIDLLLCHLSYSCRLLLQWQVRRI